MNQLEQSECDMLHDAVCFGSKEKKKKKTLGSFSKVALIGSKTTGFFFLKYLGLTLHRGS